MTKYYVEAYYEPQKWGEPDDPAWIASKLREMGFEYVEIEEESR